MLTNLDDILESLEPRLDPDEYVYCTVPTKRDVPWTSETLIAVVREDEGYTAVIERDEARQLGFAVSDGFRRISLGVHSSLHAVGLTAVAARALANCGISANVIAGYYHDHFLVPSAKAQVALKALQELSRSGPTDY